MPPEQNQQSRRPHYHRGRRGSDRRGPDRRNLQPPQQEQAGRDQQDVEQIMREIRARISQRHGIELTTQQIQELAARRLEAILDPRTVNPSLLEQLRRNAAKVPETPPAHEAPAYTFEDRTIYESHNGFLRFMRRLLNPILKLFFNPNPIAHALNAQAKLNAALAASNAERERRQAEWNALHYDLLQRLVTETARVSIEMQSMAARVEALGARVDFNDRRVRGIEASAQPSRPQPRQQPEPRAAAPMLQPPTPSPSAPEEAVATEARSPDAAATEAGRRKRRRRRGRRSGSLPGEAGGAAPAEAQPPENDAEAGEGPEFDDGGEDDGAIATMPDSDATSDSADAMSPAAEREAYSAVDSEGHATETSVAEEGAFRAQGETLDAPSETPSLDDISGASPVVETPEPQAAAPAPEPQPSNEPTTAAAAPPPFPQDDEGVATTPPSPPRDEPAPADAEPASDTERERMDR
jgi:hypothetical protein